MLHKEHSPANGSQSDGVLGEFGNENENRAKSPSYVGMPPTSTPSHSTKKRSSVMPDPDYLDNCGECFIFH